MSLTARIEAILSSPRPGAAPQVRTSPAFAARFEAEAKRSGLTVDLEEKSTEQMIKTCSVCGAQNSRYVSTCFNCQSDLAETREPEQPQVILRKKLPEARWLHILATPKNSPWPIIEVPLNRARFTPPPPPAAVTGTQVLGRFLSLFVEREKEQPKVAGRFDSRSALDKFLGVFIEKNQ